MSMSKLYYSDSTSGLPKWQVALAIGGSVAVGLGIYYYVVKKEDPTLTNKGSKAKAPTPSNSMDVPDEEPITDNMVIIISY